MAFNDPKNGSGCAGGRAVQTALTWLSGCVCSVCVCNVFTGSLTAPQALMENTQDEMNQVGISSD